jgi:cyclic pyranopterin phosphate synthase
MIDTGEAQIKAGGLLLKIRRSNLTFVSDLITDKRGRGLRDLRISLIDACGFRCRYCMPENGHYTFLPSSELMTPTEIGFFTEIFVSLGVSKIRLTGGEPLLRREVCEIVSRVASVSGVTDLALTTNGEKLTSVAGGLKQAGLTRLGVSFDADDALLFDKMTGTHGMRDKVLTGIYSALSAGFSPIKINAVIQKGVNDSEVLPLMKLFSGKDYVLRFIEYMDVGNQNAWKASDVSLAEEILQTMNSEETLAALPPLYRGEVAKRFARKDGGEVGLITSVSQPFCSDCFRARLSANGHLYTCLFASKGTDLLTPLRNGAGRDEMVSLIKMVWQNRDDRYSEIRNTLTKPQPKVEMFHIGG